MMGFLSNLVGYGGENRNIITSFGMKMVIRVLVLFLLMDGLFAAVAVKEINKGNFEEYLKGKLFVVTYVDSTSCSRCRNLYPFYYAASQSFREDQDVFFTRTYDKQFIQDWGIKELPALVYHKKGVDPEDVYGTRGVISVDITVDDVLKGIEKVLHGDFGTLKKKYIVSLEPEIYDEIVMTPAQSTLMLIYDKKSKKEALPIIHKVAKAFRKDDAILFTSLDADKYQDLRNSRFTTKDSPSIMWLQEKDNKVAKRFGGMLTIELITTFINEQTGLNRMSNGALLRTAGRIPAVDQLLEEHADIIYEAKPEFLTLLSKAVEEEKEKIYRHEAEMLVYYVSVLEELKEAESSLPVFEELLTNFDAILYGDEELSTKTGDKIKRQKNIVIYFQDLANSYKKGDWKKSGGKRERVDAKVTLKPKRHVHTEL